MRPNELVRFERDTTGGKMKAVFLMAAGFLFSSSALAGISERSSWEEIFKSNQTTVIPEHKAGLAGLEIYNVCINNDWLSSIKDVTRCVEPRSVEVRGEGEGDARRIEWVCTKKVTGPISVLRAYTQNVCVEMAHKQEGEGSSLECVKFEKKRFEVPRTIDTWVTVRHGESSYSFLKEYKFKTCD